MKKIYSHPNRGFARLVAEKLEAAGIRVFVQTRDPMVSGFVGSSELTTVYVRQDEDEVRAAEMVRAFTEKLENLRNG